MNHHMVRAVLGVNFLPELYFTFKAWRSGEMIFTQAVDFMWKTGNRVSRKGKNKE